MGIDVRISLAGESYSDVFDVPALGAFECALDRAFSHAPARPPFRRRGPGPRTRSPSSKGWFACAQCTGPWQVDGNAWHGLAADALRSPSNTNKSRKAKFRPVPHLFQVCTYRVTVFSRLAACLDGKQTSCLIIDMRDPHLTPATSRRLTVFGRFAAPSSFASLLLAREDRLAASQRRKIK